MRPTDPEHPRTSSAPERSLGLASGFNAEAAPDVIVTPEQGELEDRFMGDFAARIGSESGAPVLVVRVRAAP